MLKRRDNVAIGTVGEYLQMSCEDLKNARNQLDIHINNLLNSYKGNDAEVIVEKFLEASSKINNMIQIIEYYGKYMKGISMNDKENIQSSTNAFKAIADEPIIHEQKITDVILSTQEIEEAEDA